MKRSFLIAAALALLVFAIAIQARTETRVMSGSHKVVMDIISADYENHPVEKIPTYKNRTFSQKVLSRDEFGIRIEITVNLDPLNSTAPFPVQGISDAVARKSLRAEKDIQSDDPSIIQTARQITAGATTVSEAVEKISNFVHDHITYTIPVSQDALSVLRSGKGSCQGYTRLSIALARAVGIPARYAHGYLPPGQDWGAKVERFGVRTSGGGYHAWIEFFYPDVGWAFTDGEYTKMYVDPYHIVRWVDEEPQTPMPRNAVEILDSDTGLTYSKVEDSDQTRWTDAYTGPKNDMLGVQVRPQLTGAVWGYLTDATGQKITNAKMIVWGDPDSTGRMTGDVISLPESGIYSVAGLGSGKKRITIQIGAKKQDFSVEAQRGVIKRQDLTVK